MVAAVRSFFAMIGSISVVLALMLATNAEGKSEPVCPQVREVKNTPFYDERGIDPAYNKLRFEDGCESVLWETVTSTVRMTDPGKLVPKEERFVEGDLALFILLMRYDLSLEQVLPESEAENYKLHGIFAYFDYVQDPRHRTQCVARLRKLTGRG